MRFNEFFKNHWAGCRLLANARDEHRNRDVRIYQVPGEFDFVGVSDGVDAWIAPTSINPFSVDVRKLLGEIRAGNTVAAPQPFIQRRRIGAPAAPQEPEPAKVTRRSITTPQAGGRHAIRA